MRDPRSGRHRSDVAGGAHMPPPAAPCNPGPRGDVPPGLPVAPHLIEDLASTDPESWESDVEVGGLCLSSRSMPPPPPPDRTETLVPRAGCASTLPVDPGRPRADRSDPGDLA